MAAGAARDSPQAPCQDVHVVAGPGLHSQRDQCQRCFALRRVKPQALHEPGFRLLEPAQKSQQATTIEMERRRIACRRQSLVEQREGPCVVAEPKRKIRPADEARSRHRARPRVLRQIRPGGDGLAGMQ